MLFGAVYLRFGSLLGKSWRLEEFIGKAVAISEPCSKVDVSGEEAQQWKNLALTDDETSIVRAFLREKGFTGKVDRTYVAQSNCEGKVKTAVSVPYTKFAGDGLEGMAIAVFVSE